MRSGPGSRTSPRRSMCAVDRSGARPFPPLRPDSKIPRLPLPPHPSQFRRGPFTGKRPDSTIPSDCRHVARIVSLQRSVSEVRAGFPPQSGPLTSSPRRCWSSARYPPASPVTEATRVIRNRPPRDGMQTHTKVQYRQPQQCYQQPYHRPQLPVSVQPDQKVLHVSTLRAFPIRDRVSCCPSLAGPAPSGPRSLPVELFRPLAVRDDGRAYVLRSIDSTANVLSVASEAGMRRGLPPPFSRARKSARRCARRRPSRHRARGA